MKDKKIFFNNLALKNKKLFFSGVAIGIVLIMLVEFIFSSFSAINRSVVKKEREIYRIIENYYIGEYNPDYLIECMYAGLVYGLGDPYSNYFDATSYEKFTTNSNGVFAGIGIQVKVDEEDNLITVTSVFEGSPAYEVGILEGDKILEVDDVEVGGDNLDSAISMIQGEVGTTVNLLIYRPDTQESFEVDVARAVVEHPTVYYEMLDDQIGYIRITSFEEVTTDQFMKAYDELNAMNMEGLIVDVRNNPGGLLNVVVDITDVLVPIGGNIVYTESKDGTITEFKSEEENFGKPLVILVNGNSASASEVLAGAVQDYGSGVIVGTTTFGKGIVQSLIDLGDGTGMKLTTAKYYTPSGTSIHGTGIEPDYVVPMSDELSNDIGNLTLEEDVQLQAGIDIINSMK